jgi:sugar transferase (PEP-CTERM/EpsH1 system associated)
VIDLVDVDSEKWAALAQTTRGPRGWVFAREARRLAEFERRAARKARAVLVVTEREEAALRRLSPDARIRVVPNGIDTTAFEPENGPAEEPRVVFCGVMNYQPNVDAAVWFCRQVWPRIVARRPEARLALVGSSPTAAVQRLAAENATITVTGAVADVRPFLWSAAVSVAPLLTARGIQNKVLEAVAARLPVVVTSPVFDGLPLEARPACLVADDPEGFGDRVLHLLAQSGTSRRAIADTASLHTLTWARQLAPLVDILKDAAFGAARYEVVECKSGARAHGLADANGVEHS